MDTALTTISMGYYSIDDIETEGQQVPATFEVTVPRLEWTRGQDARGEGNGPVLEGTRVSLPLWLAGPLASTRISADSDTAFVTLEEPPAFAPETLNALKSDAEAVDLRAQSPVFTNLALYWLDLFGSEELSRVLYETTQTRTALILDSAGTTSGSNASNTLDEYERSLYRAAHMASRDLKQWNKQE